MPPTFATLVVILAAYLAGSLPFGLLIGLWFRGIDIRKAGSGNIGATNAARVLGTKWGFACLVLDALKGLCPTLLLPFAFFAMAAEASADAVGHVRVACGIATIVGHMFPCWLGFRGGKGVATALGVVVVIAPLATLVAFGTFALTFAAKRIVSLGSVLAAIAFAVCEMILLQPDPFSPENWSRGAFSLLVPALIIFRHRSNIRRLLTGEEPTFRSGRAESERATSANGSETTRSEGSQPAPLDREEP